MKKVLLFLLIVLLGISWWQKDSITQFVVQKMVFKDASIQTEPNNYYKDDEFLLIKETNNFSPKSKNEFNDILFTILNKGWNDFSFYCSYEYKECIDDFTDFIQNSEYVEGINNYAHPYNEFNNITITTSNFNKITIQIDKLYNDTEISAINEKINSFIKDNVTNDMTDTDKIKVFHDYLINNTKYDAEFNIETGKSTYATHPYNAYGTLFEGKAVCGGYSDAMAIYLDAIGIKNYKIASAQHIWNYVYVDNNWYHLDLTWDDPVTSDNTDLLIYDFFLITTPQLEKLDTTEHTYNKNLYLEAK